MLPQSAEAISEDLFDNSIVQIYVWIGGFYSHQWHLSFNNSAIKATCGNTAVTKHRKLGNWLTRW